MLTQEPIRFFERTSGSTATNKLIPYTNGMLREVSSSPRATTAHSTARTFERWPRVRLASGRRDSMSAWSLRPTRHCCFAATMDACESSRHSRRGSTTRGLSVALDRFRRAPFVRVVLSEDGRSAMLAATMMPDRASMSDRSQIRAELDAEAARLAKTNGLHMLTGGYPVQRDLLTQAINTEFAKLYPVVLLVIVIVLSVLLRSVLATVAPLVVVAIAALLTTGLMHVTGLPPNIFVAPVFVLTAVIGVSDSVHLLSRYRDLRAKEGDVRTAVEQTVRDLALPCFLTSLTTAMAFAALALSAVPMIAHFGMHTAIGVLAAYAATFLLVPPLLVLLARPVHARPAGPIEHRACPTRSLRRPVSQAHRTRRGRTHARRRGGNPPDQGQLAAPSRSRSRTPHPRDEPRLGRTDGRRHRPRAVARATLRFTRGSRNAPTVKPACETSGG